MGCCKKKERGEGEEPAPPIGRVGRSQSTMRDRVGSVFRRGPHMGAPSIHEGDFGGSKLLNRPFFDWSDRPWYKPLDPIFFVLTMSGLFVLLFYGLIDVLNRLSTFDGTSNAYHSSVGDLAVGGVVAMSFQFISYLVTVYLGAKVLVIFLCLLHLMFTVLSFWQELAVAQVITLVTFLLTWPFLWVKWQSLPVANAHIRVWREMAGKRCGCASGYGFNMLINIILMNAIGYCFMMLWSAIFLGYMIYSHVQEGSDGGWADGLVFLLLCTGFWGAETIRNFIYCLLGNTSIIWSKSKEDYAVFVSTIARVMFTHFGASSYAAFVLPILEPLYGLAYWCLDPFLVGEKSEKGCCGKTNFSIIKHYANGLQELKTYYNYKGLLMTTAFGVPFVEGSNLTSYIPKEENPTWAYLTGVNTVTGAAVTCFICGYWAHNDDIMYFWKDLIQLAAWILGYALSALTCMAFRGASDAFDFLRHDDVGAIKRGRDTFSGMPAGIHAAT